MENTIKMLIAEDSAEFADVGTAVYEEFGVSPSFCEKDGTALLEEIRKQSPDVVVMDMFMKNIDAVGVMKNGGDDGGSVRLQCADQPRPTEHQIH